MAKASSSQKLRAANAQAKREGVPIDSPGAPAEGSEAGDAGDVGHQRMVGNVMGHRAAAVRHFRAAQRLADQNPTAAEQEARGAIVEIVRAFWWAEDSELEEDQHRPMHEIGLWTRRRFGCSIHFDGKRYEQRCQIDIAHRRFGFSVGYTATAICSICGEDVSECPHLPDKEYWVRGGVGASGHCPVCMAKADCQHRPNRLYTVTLTKIITDMDVREISFVSRPAGVTTRLLGIPVDNADLIEAFGPDFEVGMPVSCDKCLNGRWGFNEFDPDALLEGNEPPEQEVA
jgi:hypothetical protein